MTKTSSTFLIFSFVLFLGLPALAAKPAGAVNNDPLEPVNRAVFSMNDFLDRVFIGPVAKGYNKALPQFVRDSVQSFMRNLKSPLIITNNLLQGEIGDAGIATARFAINTTAGVLGLADVAEHQGLPYRDEDLGQTLATWGIGEGPYLVLPILGPSNLRDSVGLVGDSLADPVRIVTFHENEKWIYYTREAVEGLDNRARLDVAIDDLRRNSLDPYASMQSAYRQRRMSEIDNKSERIGGGYEDFQ